MHDRIYLLDEDGTPAALSEERFDKEADLQELIADHPDLIDGEQIDPANPRRWIVVAREVGIPDAADAADRWHLDHLFIDQDAIPTLVEVKRGADSRIRRYVVGQMLDYAAHAPSFWTTEVLRSAFEGAHPTDHAERLRKLLARDDVDTDEFWAQVSRNLDAPRLRLLFVADHVPDELARVVDFLNKQMRVEVLAVELKQYRGSPTSRTLVPRVFGRQAKPRTRPTRRDLTRDEFLEQFHDNDVRSIVSRLLDHARAAGATSGGSRRFSIQAPCPLWRNRISIAWITPPGPPEDDAFASNHLLFGVFPAWNPAELPSVLLERLRRWCGLFENRPGFVEIPNPWSATKPSEWEGVPCYAIPHSDAGDQVDFLADAMAQVVRDLSALDDTSS